MRKSIFIFLFILSSMLPALAGAEHDSVLQNFLKANMSYRDGKYADAISGYEAVLARGLESGPLYYNLGNSYFKAGQTGKAVLSYERAQKLIPRDNDLLVNEKYVQSTIGELPVEGRTFWQNALERHKEFYSVDEMAVILLVLLFLIAASHLAGLYFPAFRRVGARVMIVLGVVFGIYAAGFVLKIDGEKGLSVVIKRSSAKFEPSDKATVYFELLEGQKVKALERDGGWQKIERLDGKMGWVPDGDIEKI